MVNSFASDDEPLYDSVASDEDYSSVDNLSLQNMKTDEKSGSAPDLRMPATEVRMVNVLKFYAPNFLTKWHMQTVQTQIILEQSDHYLHYLPFN